MREQALCELSVFNLRNLHLERMALSPSCTVILGDNGQGKTSLLEAIGLGMYGKSFRTSKLAEVVGRQSSSATIRLCREALGEQECNGLSIDAEGGKALFRNGEPVSLKEYLFPLGLLALTPVHITTLRDSAEKRRTWLDSFIFCQDRNHHRAVNRLGRIIEQKKALLRQDRIELELLSAINRQILQCSAQISARRKAQVEALSRQFAQVHQELFGGKERHSLDFLSQASRGASQEEMEQLYAQALLAAEQEEKVRQRCLIGAHNDDLCFSTQSYGDIRRQASSGEWKSALLTMVCRQAQQFSVNSELATVILLDELSAELDEKRVTGVLAIMEKLPVQCFITATEQPCGLQGRTDTEVIKLKEGRVAERMGRSAGQEG